MRLIVASVAACVLASAIAVGATAAHRFAPTDPLTGSQWYLTRTKALDGWDLLPDLQPVRVAVVDSGLDLGHPEFAGRIVAARSFVGGSAQDVRGHGTVVAGIIAAGVDNGVGIAGLAPSAELLVAKVVGNNGSISVKAEARAIRWAVDNGARVINMSLGGLRDPRELARDTYSRTEADAIRYAVAHDVLVVAAVGNGDAAPHEPWPFASYPAALPHVLGVSAIARSGTSPGFSNRDPLYNDLAAPGEEVASTFPRALTDARQGCAEQGYTQCATDEFQSPEGTSFAAPQVSAVAANLLAVDPKLSADQVATILTRTADDASAASGCTICPLGRDAFTGWGELDGMAALAALAGPLPPADRFEPNDDVGTAAYRLYLAGGKRGRTVKATVDFWDDPDDLYGIYLRPGERVFASLKASSAGDLALAVWRPGARSVADLAHQDLRVALSSRPGRVERLSYTAREPGWHFLQAHLTAQGGPVAYTLSVVRAGGVPVPTVKP